MTSERRPLSPHLQVYRPQITSVLSITHRGTGLVLALGGLLLVYWLGAIAAGPAAYAQAMELLGSLPGQLVMLGVAFSFYYHFCNGIRHLFWDAGKGIDIPAATVSGWIVIVAAIALTVLSALLAAGLVGGGA